MRRRILIILAVILAVAVAGWFFDAPTRLGWVKPVVTRLSLYGNVDIRQVQLGFRVSGRLAEMNVEEGDAVKAGAILARLDTRPLWDQHRAAEAKLAAQAANLAKLEAGPRPAEIAKARAQHAERLAELQNASLTFGRTSQLAPNGTTSKASLDQARANRDTAAARADAAAEDLRLLEQGTRLEEIAAAKANYQEAEANLATAQTSLADADLKAPADGVILSRVREPGAIVSMGETVLVLSLVNPVWVRAYISEPDLGRVHPGMAVEVVSDTRPDQPYRGTVGFISSVAEFTPKTVETADLRTDLVYRLRVVVNDDGSGLRQGMPVTVRIPNAKIAADDGPS